MYTKQQIEQIAREFLEGGHGDEHLDYAVARQKLEGRHRAIITLYAEVGFTFREIAAQPTIEYSRSSLQRLYTEAMSKLKELMNGN